MTSRAAPRETLILWLTVAVALCAVPAWAHHGKDFLLVEGVEIPHAGQRYLLASQDASREEGGTLLGVSPAVLLGVSDVVAFELHAHAVRKEGEWTYEATAPALRIRIPGSGRVRFGIAAEYEIAHEAEAHDHVEGRLMIGYRPGSAAVVVNLLAARAARAGEPAQIGYAVGLRPSLGSRVGWGVEAEGGLRNREGHEVLLGVYAEPSDRLALKLGVGQRFGDASTWTVRTGFVFRF